MFKRGIEGKLLSWFLFIALVPILVIGLIGVQHLRQSLWKDIQREIARDIAEREISIGNLATSYQQRLDIFGSNLLVQDLLSKFNRMDLEAPSQILGEDDPHLPREVEEFLETAGFIAIRISGKNGKDFYHSVHQDTQNFFSQNPRSTQKNMEPSALQFILGAEHGGRHVATLPAVAEGVRYRFLPAGIRGLGDKNC